MVGGSVSMNKGSSKPSMWWGAGDFIEGGVKQGGVKQRFGFLVGVYRGFLQLWTFHGRVRRTSLVGLDQAGGS